MPELPDGLSIGELARRTQVPAPTLRSWEDRYGFRGRIGWPVVIAATTTVMSASSRRSEIEAPEPVSRIACRSRARETPNG